MSKKNEKLLQESTVRRFMGLAGIPAITAEHFVDNKLNELDKLDEDEPDIQDTEMDVPAEEPLQEQEDEMTAAADLPEGELAPEGELPPEEEMLPEEEGVADIDLTIEEAEVLIGLGQRLAEELPEEEVPEEGLPEEGAPLPEEGVLPEEELPPPEAMAESFLRTLSHRVSQRLLREQKVSQRKEQFVNTVMKRVARRLRNGR